MTQKIIPHRPAWIAIAAVLAATTPPLAAQTAQPGATPPDSTATTSAPPPIVPAPEPGVTTTPPASPTQSTVPQSSSPFAQPSTPSAPTQSTAPIPLLQTPDIATPDIAPPAAPATSTAPTTSASPSAPAPAARTQPNSVASSQAPTSAAASTPALADEGITIAPSQNAQQAIAPQPQIAPATPVGATTTDGLAMDSETLQAILAGLAVVLGVAGLAFAFGRRRKHASKVSPIAASEHTTAKPEPVAEYRREQPEPAAPEAPAAPHTTPARASSFRTAAADTAARGGRFAQLEAMVGEAPSAQNPFLTRRNRLRRANFILRQQEMDSRPAPQPEPETVRARQPEPVSAKNRSQEVYDFGNSKPGWKPFKPAKA